MSSTAPQERSAAQPPRTSLLGVEFSAFLRSALDYGDNQVHLRVSRMHFMAWRAAAAWLRAGRRVTVSVDSSPSYPQARFLGDLMRVEYARHLNALWTWLTHMATGSNTSVRAWETFTVAHDHMPWAAIKTCSYSGAVVRVSRGRPQHWLWYDPGNWCYAAMWHLLKKTARHWKDVYRPVQGSREGKAAARIHQSMAACETRWPRQGTAFYELVGDLFEMLLARGYCSAELEHVIDDLSLIVAEILAIYRNMQANSRMSASPHIEPYLFADALLTARGAHQRPGADSWSIFHRVCRSRAPAGAQP